jgi:hypothetical protein
MGQMTDLDIDFCNDCGKVLSEAERPGPYCEICENTDPEIDPDAEYMAELEDQEIQNEYEW